MKKVSILDMAEDLIDADLSSDIDKNQTVGSKKLMSTKYLSLESLITDVAVILKMPVEEIHDWINEALIPENILKTILTTAKRLKLNPVLGHIAWERNQKGCYEIYIPIDGWIAMIHREPSFQGVAFNQSEETENGVPIWMECTIYRANLTHPVTVREYYEEVKRDHTMWQEIPRRMLRYKTLQQCAKLVFGITAPGLRASSTQKADEQIRITKLSKKPPKNKELLKQKLCVN